jgi:F-type H+-transporting ATPase subunit delta
MAEKTTIARPYARAAFDHATATGQLAAWADGLAAAATVVETPGVATLLSNPHVTTAELAELVSSIVADAGGAGARAAAPADAGLRNFIGDLASNHRLGVLPEIAGLFHSMKDEAERTVDVEVTSAAPLDDGQRKALSVSLERRLKRAVRLHCAVDPALIGGAVLRAGDLVIDGSLRARLDRFQYELGR